MSLSLLDSKLLLLLFSFILYKFSDIYLVLSKIIFFLISKIKLKIAFSLLFSELNKLEQYITSSEFLLIVKKKSSFPEALFEIFMKNLLFLLLLLFIGFIKIRNSPILFFSF
jgi:hypothetical protein